MVLVEGSIEVAWAITHEKVTTVTRSGTTKTKSVLVPLVPKVKQQSTTSRHPILQADPSYFEDNTNTPVHKDDIPPKANKVIYVLFIIV